MHDRCAVRRRSRKSCLPVGEFCATHRQNPSSIGRDENQDIDHSSCHRSRASHRVARPFLRRAGGSPGVPDPEDPTETGPVDDRLRICQKHLPARQRPARTGHPPSAYRGQSPRFSQTIETRSFQPPIRRRQGDRIDHLCDARLPRHRVERRLYADPHGPEHGPESCHDLRLHPAHQEDRRRHLQPVRRSPRAATPACRSPDGIDGLLCGAQPKDPKTTPVSRWPLGRTDIGPQEGCRRHQPAYPQARQNCHLRLALCLRAAPSSPSARSTAPTMRITATGSA